MLNFGGSISNSSSTSGSIPTGQTGRVAVTITGAAGRIAYAMIPLILSGAVFGPSVRIDLRLLDIPVSTQKLEGVRLEIEDSCYDLLDNLIITTKAEEAFTGCEVAILLGGFPRLQGEERSDLILKNARGMADQGKAISQFADPDCRVVVIANPANSNCLVALRSAPNIPAKNWTSLSRLDHERLRGMVARLSKVSPSDVRNCLIFGNHSATQVPFVGCAEIKEGGTWKKLAGGDFAAAHAAVTAEMGNITPLVQNRGAEVIRLQGAGSAFSAANAIMHHIRDWLGVGAACDASEVFSLGVLSNGNSYGVPEGLIYALPCRRSAKEPSSKFANWEMVDGISLDETTKTLLHKTTDDLLLEREICSRIVPELQHSKL